MPDPSAFKKFVETGRVVLLKGGPHAGKTAVIVEIIDHNRVRNRLSSRALSMRMFISRLPTGCHRWTDNRGPSSIFSLQTPYSHQICCKRSATWSRNADSEEIRREERDRHKMGCDFLGKEEGACSTEKETRRFREV
ncbi:hypothetical protein FRC20_010461 [Serendipita sp. 405]|nr:hypothetical protein FRC20_010461 [Serendipita sp. 405]